MNPISKFTIFLIALCLATFMDAQSGLNLTLKTGFLSGKQVLHSSNVSFGKNDGHLGDSNGMVGLNMSLPVKGKFRLGAEVGLNTIEEFQDRDFEFSSTTINYLGYYRISQGYFAIAPEFRILPWAFVNVGGGFYADFQSSFVNGSRFNGGISEDLTGQSLRRFNSTGFFAGLGICPNLTKDLAILAEVRYLSSPASTDSPDQIGIGFSAVCLNIGLMYKPK